MEKSDKLINYKRLAKSVSYGKKSDLKDIDFIVVHFTANGNDTAKNNVDYFYVFLWPQMLLFIKYFPNL